MTAKKIFILFLISSFIGSGLAPAGAQPPEGEYYEEYEDIGPIDEDIFIDDFSGIDEGFAPEEPDQVVQQAAQQQRQIETASSGNVTMDFKDADIHNVLRILSYKGGVNIVAGPDVEGNVTIRLTDVPWEQALDIVLKTYGFTYEKLGNLIRVTTIESMANEELTTEVYTINFAKASEVMASVENMLTDRGKVKYDDRTNVLVATDIATNLDKISEIVSKLDRRTQQVLIEAKIIETRLDDSERLGIDWKTKISAIGAAKPLTFPFTRLVEGKMEQQFDRFFGGGSVAAAVPGAQFAGTASAGDFPNTGPDGWSVFPFVDADDFTFGTLDFTEFQAVMEFIKERSDTDVLSNPRITTLNNKEASILVGSQFLFPSFNFNEETGDFVISGYGDKKDVGIKLTVTPHINDMGDIIVKLQPEIKSYTGIETLDDARGIVAPFFETREATTEVMVRDGDTIMLGGLITKTTEYNENKVPILGDIPLIGDYLFTKKVESVDRKELVIFVTVHLIKDVWETEIDPNVRKFSMPLPKDAETFMALPKSEKEEAIEKAKQKRTFQEALLDFIKEAETFMSAPTSGEEERIKREKDFRDQLNSLRDRM